MLIDDNGYGYILEVRNLVPYLTESDMKKQNITMPSFPALYGGSSGSSEAPPPPAPIGPPPGLEHVLSTSSGSGHAPDEKRVEQAKESQQEAKPEKTHKGGGI